MKRSAPIPSPVSLINDRHIPRVDQFYRMCAGASSRLLELRERSFVLEIKIDHRVSEECVTQLIWNIAQSWRCRNPELGHCVMCLVNLHRSPGPTGFMLRGNREGAGMDPAVIAARIHEIECASSLPAPFIARYFISFTLFEGIGKIQETSAVAADN